MLLLLLLLLQATEKGKALLEESRLQDDTAWQVWRPGPARALLLL